MNHLELLSDIYLSVVVLLRPVLSFTGMLSSQTVIHIYTWKLLNYYSDLFVNMSTPD